MNCKLRRKVIEPLVVERTENRKNYHFISKKDQHFLDEA